MAIRRDSDLYGLSRPPPPKCFAEGLSNPLPLKGLARGGLSLLVSSRFPEPGRSLLMKEAARCSCSSLRKGRLADLKADGTGRDGPASLPPGQPLLRTAAETRKIGRQAPLGVKNRSSALPGRGWQ